MIGAQNLNSSLIDKTTIRTLVIGLSHYLVVWDHDHEQLGFLWDDLVNLGHVRSDPIVGNGECLRSRYLHA